MTPSSCSTRATRPTRLGRLLAAGALALPLAAGLAPQAQAAAPPAPSSSPGCSATPTQQPGTSVDHTLVSGGRERTYRVHLPDGYRSDRAWPVVLVFHGRGNTAILTEGFSGLSELPAVVVYPNGLVGTGSGDRQAWEGAPYEPPGVDDVAFTEDLIDEVSSTWCTDPSRVYATGKSNGAGFVNLLACRLSDRIAAVAPVSGAFYPGTRTDCDPGRPVPYLDIHGTADTTIPYAGDADRDLPAIPDHVAGWAARNGCRPDPVTRNLADDVTLTRWTGCDRNGTVEHVAVLGGGHTWPGEDAYSGGGYATQSVEGADLAWAFFRSHRLPTVPGAVAAG